jgi:hypothetical protein
MSFKRNLCLCLSLTAAAAACKNRGYNSNAGSLSTEGLGEVMDTENATTVIVCKRDAAQSFVVTIDDNGSGKVGFQKGSDPAKVIPTGSVTVFRSGIYTFSFTKTDSSGNEHKYAGNINAPNKTFTLKLDGEEMSKSEPCVITNKNSTAKPKTEDPIF